MSFRLSGSVVPTGRREAGGMAHRSASLAPPHLEFSRDVPGLPGPEPYEVPRNL